MNLSMLNPLARLNSETGPASGERSTAIMFLNKRIDLFSCGKGCLPSLSYFGNIKLRRHTSCEITLRHKARQAKAAAYLLVPSGDLQEAAFDLRSLLEGGHLHYPIGRAVGCGGAVAPGRGDRPVFRNVRVGAGDD